MIDNDGVDELPCATVGIGDHNDTGHLRLLPPSSNWYSSQVSADTDIHLVCCNANQSFEIGVWLGIWSCNTENTVCICCKMWCLCLWGIFIHIPRATCLTFHLVWYINHSWPATHRSWNEIETTSIYAICCTIESPAYEEAEKEYTGHGNPFFGWCNELLGAIDLPVVSCCCQWRRSIGDLVCVFTSFNHFINLTPSCT